MLWFPEYVKKTSPGDDTSDARVFEEGLFVALSSLPGNFLSILFADVVGVKILLSELHIIIY